MTRHVAATAAADTAAVATERGDGAVKVQTLLDSHEHEGGGNGANHKEARILTLQVINMVAYEVWFVDSKSEVISDFWGCLVASRVRF